MPVIEQDITDHDSLFLGPTQRSAADINAARSDEFVVNSRGQRIHMRSSWPPGGPAAARGVVFGLHGYGAHISRPPQVYLAQQLSAAGLAYVALDFHGHGYSEGTRGLVQAPAHLLDDALSGVLALYELQEVADGSATSSSAAAGATGGAGAAAVKPDSRKHHVQHSLAGSDLPLFVLGHSMGGGTALLLSNVLAHGASSAAVAAVSSGAPYLLPPDRAARLAATAQRHFAGAALLCPVVEALVPPAARALFVSPLAALLPSASLPVSIMDENESNHKVWASKRYRQYLKDDGFPSNPHGLSYGGNIRFRTLSTILSVAGAVQATIPQASFPFLILHDMENGGDVVVPASGSRLFVEGAPSASKALVNVPGGLHDLLANKPDGTARLLVEWFAAQLPRLPAAAAGEASAASASLPAAAPVTAAAAAEGGSTADGAASGSAAVGGAGALPAAPSTDAASDADADAAATGAS